MATLERLTDGDMVKAQRAAMLDPAAPTPSVEAILHAIIPFTFVDHTHADAVVAVSNTPGGPDRIKEIYGDRVLVVPYVMPGFILARTVSRMIRGLDWGRHEGMVLLHHGIFSWGPDARASYERMIALVTEAEAYLARMGAARAPAVATASGSTAPGESELELAAFRRAVSRVRGAPMIARLDDTPEALGFAARRDATSIATRGPLTPDHVIRTRLVPAVVNGDPAATVERYAETYRAYFERWNPGGLSCLDPAPRWAVWPGRGIVALGASATDAAIVADIARHTVRAIQWGEALGGWTALPEKDLFEVEYWELEQAKLRQGGARPPFQGKVALVTGAASGIGRAAAELLHAQGAAVMGLDLSPEITRLFNRPGLQGQVCDVTDHRSLAAAVHATVRRFGGLDILVSNAGIFSPSAELEVMPAEVWQRSLELNLSSHQALLQAAIPYLKLGCDPAIVINASKNVPAPGPGAGAYSVAKAGLTQLARVAALELAKHGVRVYAIHPHAVFDTAAWTPEVLATRAKAYGMTVEQYKRNNLLNVEITSKDVAGLIAALAGPAFAKTTGAQIPIDGGSDRVI
jgi:rhamnose utilization protein RhaD (predicted bifunctional aldolase and dehydrogenase)/NAD(P)-dependent dehydrogenase (short-subunit alcohol dehydrogenase family)